jgi:hypothetical protein
MWIFWPDTRNMPLEEIAAIFGDQDEVAIYQRDIDIGENTDTMRMDEESLPTGANPEKEAAARHIES